MNFSSETREKFCLGAKQTLLKVVKAAIENSWKGSDKAVCVCVCVCVYNY